MASIASSATTGGARKPPGPKFSQDIILTFYVEFRLANDCRLLKLAINLLRSAG